MKKFYLLSLLVPQLLFAQFTDNFSDGNFTSNPVWSGDTSGFIIANIFGNDELRSNSTTASYDFYLSTQSALVNNCQWEFWVNLAFNTSGANYVDVYLTSDSANLRDSNNSGYSIKIGNTADEISLYKEVSGTAAKIIDGADGVTNSSNNILRIKVTRDSTNLWTLERDNSGTGNSYVSEGTIVDASVLTSSYFGVHIIQSTASFFQKHYFDDFYAGAIIGDTTSPSLVSVSVISNTMIDVDFSEPVEISSSENVLNYSANNGIGNPSTAVRDNSDSSIVHLTFTNSFQNGVLNTLTVSNISDLNGNILSSSSQDFLFFIPDSVTYRDVIINEFFPDPDPPIGLPNVEFVEIFNRSAKVFDLNGWILSDGTSNAVLDNYVLLPDNYLILCSMGNVSLFTGFGNTLGVGSFPSLNNTGDDLTLFDNNGLLIDHVIYDDSWYQDTSKDNGGWTLERIDSGFPCDEGKNWAASNDTSGGTPGHINSVNGTVTDTTAPSITSIEVLSSDSLKLIFSETVDSFSAAILTNYSVNNGIGNPTGVFVMSGFRDVKLSFATTFNSSLIYQLTANGLADCSGNSATSTIDFALPGAADRNYVLITEIFANPDPQVGLPAAEFVELHNVTDHAISLTDWTFSDASSSVTLPSYLLLPGDYLILCPVANVSDYSAFGKVLGLSSLPSLNNDGDELTLKTRFGYTIFYINYSGSWYRDAIKQDGGWSLEMIDTDNPCSGASNWRASNDVQGGTPGEVNSVNGANPDEIAPSLNYVLVQDSQKLILVFDESLDRTALPITHYSIEPSLLLGGSYLANPAQNEVVLLTSSLQRNIIYTLTVSDVSDCSGNVIGVNNTAQFGIPEKPDSFDLVINEILSNPVSGGSDFIELYNRSQKIIDLKNIVIASIDEEDGDTVATVISTRGFQLLPGNYVAITGDPKNITTQYNTPNPKGVIDVVDMPSFDDDEDIVAIFNRLDNNLVIDAVHYYNDWNFSLIDDLNGVSLERINYNSSSQDKNNWHSAASTVGYATPAYQNSQFGESLSASSTITIDPKTFSPNNDGYQDVLNIHYKLDQPGFVANIDIYDDDGRIIRELVNNWLLDVEGNIIWDGLNDDGEKARIGVYIVIVELFDLTGDKKKFKESCVLAGKL